MNSEDVCQMMRFQLGILVSITLNRYSCVLSHMWNMRYSTRCQKFAPTTFKYVSSDGVDDCYVELLQISSKVWNWPNMLWDSYYVIMPWVLMLNSWHNHLQLFESIFASSGIMATWSLVQPSPVWEGGGAFCSFEGDVSRQLLNQHFALVNWGNIFSILCFRIY